MVISFVTETLLSPLDISSMGDSSKRGDNTKIGVFDSGLKYCLALLLRNNINIEIFVNNNDLAVYRYNFSTFNKKCNYTEKEKELILVNVKESNNEGLDNQYIIETSFSKELGYNWELWMAYRELKFV